MGGRGSGGTRSSESSTKSTSVKQEISNFLTELEDREYGSSKRMVPAAQQKEFRNIKYDLLNNYLKDNLETVIPAGGFASGATKPQEYVHTVTKLNAYQRLLRSEVRSLQMDMDFGIVDEDRARLELRALRSIDATIKDRRERLKPYT